MPFPEMGIYRLHIIHAADTRNIRIIWKNYYRQASTQENCIQ
jgi:hypothetical protein